MAYYVIGEGNNLYEGMTKEEILAAITQAVSTHAISDVDTGFVTTIKEKNKNNPLSLWVGTEAEFNAIEEKDQNCLYIKTDDSTLEAIGEELERIDGTVTENSTALQELINDFYFKVNDTGSYTWNGAGYMTNSKTTVRFTIPLRKTLKSGQNIEFWAETSGGTAMEITLRQNGNYIVGDADVGDDMWTLATTQAHASISAYKNTATITLTLDSDIANLSDATNNDTIGIHVVLSYKIVDA